MKYTKVRHLMKRKLYFGVIIVMIPSMIALFAACSRDSYSSNGERIYFTATSSSGESITPEGFTMMMHRIACIDCHGQNGKGGTVYLMMQRFEVPDITWPELIGEEHEGGGHEDHPPYTEVTLKQAIVQGVDPAGQPLDEFMPKWQISTQDLNDLVSYIKTLK